MILPIRTETFMWLLPVVFMIHDFEEIIMMKPWLTKNWTKLEKRSPAKVIQKMAKQKAMWSSAFTMAVAEEFEMYEFWAGLLLGFFVHILVHIG